MESFRSSDFSFGSEELLFHSIKIFHGHKLDCDLSQGDTKQDSTETSIIARWVLFLHLEWCVSTATNGGSRAPVA